MSEYSKEDGKKLLKLARQSIEQEFTGGNINSFKKRIKNKFQEKRGVFVTLKKQGELRGCIGFPYPMLPLYEALIRVAKAAAFSDPRFMPLQREELKEVDIEISILSVPEKCKPEDVKIGRDGLICEFEGRSGLLLPQVAVENNFSREEFLQCLCEKAGLDKGKWNDKNFKLFKFSCQIFSEKNL
jgi:AmmeMemoRadiSam system protein A